MQKICAITNYSSSRRCGKRNGTRNTEHGTGTFRSLGTRIPSVSISDSNNLMKMMIIIIIIIMPSRDRVIVEALGCKPKGLRFQI
jgi:hypothetical protein